jgi:hypothetical protein
MTEKEPTMAFIARQLLEINQKLGVLEPMQHEMKQMKLRLDLAKGWMEGQEGVSEAQGKRLSEIRFELEKIARGALEYRNRVDAALERLVEIDTTLGGQTELQKSCYDMLAEMKASLGGEDEPSATERRAEAI